MMDHERAFRDYVTRVSFSLNMSRNQVATLRSVVADIESEHGPRMANGFAGRTSIDQYRREVEAAREKGFHAADMFIPGVRYLCSTGLIRRTKAWLEEDRRCDELRKRNGSVLRNFNIPSYELTEAGHHVVALLRIAGLIPQAIANTNKKKRRAA